MLYLGSDHGGFKLKEDLKKFLRKEKIAFVDVGARRLRPQDDYPNYAAKVARGVQKHFAGNQGILICRSGHGVCIVANKFKGIRAALAWNVAVAEHSRNDEDANVLCLPADYISAATAKKIVSAWLKTNFAFKRRYIRRIEEMLKLD